MRILLKLVLDCEPDAAWRAVRSPAVFQQVSAPVMVFSSLDEGGFTDQWSCGEHVVEAKLFGVIPAGRQLIDIRTEQRPALATHGRHADTSPVRIVHDTGRGLTWPLTLTTSWHHEMAISSTGDGRTLYRDRLRFSSGLLTPVMAVAYWVFWQARAVAMRRLSREWR
jgi:hypothetical protein